VYLFTKIVLHPISPKKLKPKKSLPQCLDIPWQVNGCITHLSYYPGIQYLPLGAQRLLSIRGGCEDSTIVTKITRENSHFFQRELAEWCINRSWLRLDLTPSDIATKFHRDDAVDTPEQDAENEKERRTLNFEMKGWLPGKYDPEIGSALSGPEWGSEEQRAWDDEMQTFKNGFKTHNGGEYAGLVDNKNSGIVPCPRNNMDNGVRRHRWLVDQKNIIQKDRTKNREEIIAVVKGCRDFWNLPLGYPDDMQTFWRKGGVGEEIPGSGGVFVARRPHVAIKKPRLEPEERWPISGISGVSPDGCVFDKEMRPMVGSDVSQADLDSGKKTEYNYHRNNRYIVLPEFAGEMNNTNVYLKLWHKRVLEYIDEEWQILSRARTGKKDIMDILADNEKTDRDDEFEMAEDGFTNDANGKKAYQEYKNLPWGRRAVMKALLQIQRRGWGQDLLPGQELEGLTDKQKKVWEDGKHVFKQPSDRPNSEHYKKPIQVQRISCPDQDIGDMTKKRCNIVEFYHHFLPKEDPSHADGYPGPEKMRELCERAQYQAGFAGHTDPEDPLSLPTTREWNPGYGPGVVGFYWFGRAWSNANGELVEPCCLASVCDNNPNVVAPRMPVCRSEEYLQVPKEFLKRRTTAGRKLGYTHFSPDGPDVLDVCFARMNHHNLRMRYLDVNKKMIDNLQPNKLDICFPGGYQKMKNIPLQHPIYRPSGYSKMAGAGTPDFMRYGSATYRDPHCAAAHNFMVSHHESCAVMHHEWSCMTGEPKRGDEGHALVENFQTWTKQMVKQHRAQTGHTMTYKDDWTAEAGKGWGWL
tara:strand:- start:301 stop:2721 length:2421 start_codon:yes stop_codon:yes gene_type:complete